MGRRAMAGLALLAVFFVWSSLFFWPHLIDDAYISLRYSRNLLEGQGLVYNPGQRVEGYSNFLWVWIGAGFLGAGLPAITWLKGLGIVAGVGVILLTHRLAAACLERLPLGTLRLWLATLFIGLHASLALWACSGLETVLFAFLILASVAAHERELEEDRTAPLSALLFALAWMTRPEAPIYGLYFLLRRGLAWRQRGWTRGDTLWCAAAALLLVPYEVWGWLYYGRLLPMTHQAKVGDVGSLSLFEQQRLLWAFVSQQGVGFVGLLVAALVGGWLGRRRMPLCVWLVPLCGLVFVLYARTDWMPRHRFFVPVLAFLGMLVAHGSAELLLCARGRSALAGGVMTLALASCFVDYARVQTFGGQRRGVASAGRIGTAARGVWFADVPHRVREAERPPLPPHLELVPEGETLCMRDIGLVGYRTRHRIWDTAGLFTPAAAAALHDSSPAVLGAMFEDLRSADPAYVYLRLVPGDSATLDHRIDRWLREDERNRARYVEVLRAVPPVRGVTRVLYMKRSWAPSDAR